MEREASSGPWRHPAPKPTLLDRLWFLPWLVLGALIWALAGFGIASLTGWV